jgi:hypothetical protein
MVINRDPERSVSAELKLPRISDGRLRSDALSGPEIGSYNSDTSPEEVSIHRKVVPVTRSKIIHAFEPHSITLLELQTAGADCPVH